jgi:hypothetical protein
MNKKMIVWKLNIKNFYTITLSINYHERGWWRGKDERPSPIIDSEEKVSRSDFLKKLVTGGIVSVAAISGLGGVQKVLGESDNVQSTSGNDDSTNISKLIHDVNKLRKQLGELQSQFANVISGKLAVPELIVDKLTTSDGAFLKLTVPGTEGGYVKINAESTFYKLNVPDTGFMKVSGDSAFVKLQVHDTEGGYVKINAESTFYKLNVPDTGFMKVSGNSAFMNLEVPETLGM